MPGRGSAKNKSAAATTIDAYLATVDGEKRAALDKLRHVIRAAAPDAEECISYGIPAFRQAGKLLVAFAAAKQHCSLYSGALPIRVHGADLRGYSTSKGTIRFAPDKPISATLVRRLIRTRLREMTTTKKATAAQAASRKSGKLTPSPAKPR